MNEEPLSDISRRKEEHIRICLENNVVYDRMSNGLEKVQIRPSSFEELSVNDINLETKFLNKTINFPLLISGITGGSKKGKEINEIIGKICQEFFIGMGVGSQRAAIENPELVSTYQVRHIASDIPLLANIGIGQLIDEYDVNDAENAITMIKADGLALHVNIQQEFLQSEGDKDFSNLKKSISQLIKESKYPLIIKGVGSGISKKDAEYLMSLNIYAVDVAGAGGTNWAKIETYRNP
ncbi:MAG: type 2 isopentenyl-diphosphate Delta-isomerase, partial [Candidatus Heimdallarchaeota archaeon]|nr:type 2 isopentenyl-diphosphate Delta-isomerase [Candidatus Heimdallarchaeota archaeon]